LQGAAYHRVRRADLARAARCNVDPSTSVPFGISDPEAAALIAVLEASELDEVASFRVVYGIGDGLVVDVGAVTA
jgi:hypothetical protein